MCVVVRLADDSRRGTRTLTVCQMGSNHPCNSSPPFAHELFVSERGVSLLPNIRKGIGLHTPEVLRLPMANDRISVLKVSQPVPSRGSRTLFANSAILLWCAPSRSLSLQMPTPLPSYPTANRSPCLRPPAGCPRCGARVSFWNYVSHSPLSL